MSITITGVVKNLELLAEIQAELDGWDRASDETLQMVECLASKYQSKRMGENSDAS